MDRNRLDGWKAIASHLNRSVRQCQRLSDSGGLPIHRVPGSRSVFAYEDELDRWLAGDAGENRHLDGVEISRSGRHVTLPVEMVDLGPDEKRRPAISPEDAASDAPSRRARKLFPVVTVILLALVLLPLGIHHRQRTAWRNGGTPLTGSWTFQNSGITGKGASVARFDTGRFAGPGTTATVTLSTCGTRWSGGLEIFQDDLHWTFFALSPREHEIVVQRFPSGTVETFFMGQSVQPARPTVFRIAVGESFVQVGCPGKKLHRLHMDPWDVTHGRLTLRVGTPGDELHEPSGGSCSFKELQVVGAPPSVPASTVEEVPSSQRPTAAYVLAASNIDDQLDVLIDGRRLASATYREKIGPLDLDPYLTRGRHTIMALVFNRKWTAAYGIRLTENDVVLWNASCGDVTKSSSGCEEIGSRLGMVKRLSFSFTAK